MGDFKIGDKVVKVNGEPFSTGEFDLFITGLPGGWAELSNGKSMLLHSIMVKDDPTLWRNMTPEEKGALLLAAHEEKVIEVYDASNQWSPISCPVWEKTCAYRIKPEPKRDTVMLDVALSNDGEWLAKSSLLPTHHITFATIDGKPVCDSIKMEEL